MVTDDRGSGSAAMARRPSGGATVLIVDDEVEIAEIYADALGDTYDVLVATGGGEALEKLGPDVDAVLLDRRMPSVPGEEVLERMHEEGYRCPVAMITAVEPDFDIVDMGFHDYVVKPVDPTELHETVENLLAIADYEGRIREYVSLSVKDATLRKIKTDDDLEQSDAYQELRDEVRELSTELGDWSAEVDPEDFDRVLRMVVRSL